MNDARWQHPSSTDELIERMSVSSSSDILYARQRMIEMRAEIEELTAKYHELLYHDTAKRYIRERATPCAGCRGDSEQHSCHDQLADSGNHEQEDLAESGGLPEAQQLGKDSGCGK